MKRKRTVSRHDLVSVLENLYWTLHRHSKANNNIGTPRPWLGANASDEFDSDGCISGFEFETFMPLARKLLNKIHREAR